MVYTTIIPLIKNDSNLIDAIHFLKLESFFEWKVSPLSIVCPGTGSKFIFRGLDDRKKLKSLKDISIC